MRHGRPSLDVGTYGEIRTRDLANGKVEATAQYRDADGITRQYTRRGATKAAAVRALKRYLTGKPARQAATGAITADTRMPVLAEEFLARIDRLADAGDRSPGTARLYRGHWANYIRPAVEGLTVAECDVHRLDSLLVELRQRHSADLVKSVRAVLSGMMGIAVRRKAITSNPVRDVEAIPSGKRALVRALEPGEAVDLWEKLTVLSRTPSERSNNRRYRATVVSPDLPDLVLWMLGTSERIGQAIAVHWPWLNLGEAVAELGPNVIRVKGKGLRLNWGTTKTRERVLDLPEPVVAMLLLRHEKATNPMGPVFPDSFGGLRDPHNTLGELRRAFDLAGYRWVTSHVLRKTVATVLDDAGLSARHIADQLGHARPSMTQDRYMKRGARNPKAKAALEAVFATQPEQRAVPTGL